MKKRLLSLLLLCCMMLAGCGASAPKDPFTLTAEPVQLVTEDGVSSVKLCVAIDNLTEQDFKNVSYTVSFSKEAEDAVGPLTSPASEPMNVTTEEKAVDAEDAVWGFEWNQRIELPETVKNPQELFQELTVNITWDGGKQSTAVPLTWK